MKKVVAVMAIMSGLLAMNVVSATHGPEESREPEKTSEQESSASKLTMEKLKHRLEVLLKSPQLPANRVCGRTTTYIASILRSADRFDATYDRKICEVIWRAWHFPGSLTLALAASPSQVVRKAAYDQLIAYFRCDSAIYEYWLEDFLRQVAVSSDYSLCDTAENLFLVFARQKRVSGLTALWTSLARQNQNEMALSQLRRYNPLSNAAGNVELESEGAPP